MTRKPKRLLLSLFANEKLLQQMRSRCFKWCSPLIPHRILLFSRGEILDAHMFDVALAAYVADSNNGAATLNALMERYAGAVLPDEKDPQKQVALQAAAIGALVDPLAQELEKEGARKVYDDIDLPLVGVLACMERTGAAWMLTT